MTTFVRAIVFEFARVEQPEDPFAFRFARQQYTLRTQGGGRSSLEVAWSRELLLDLVAVRQPGCDPAVVQRVGNLLATLMASARWPETAKQVSEALATGSVIVTVRSNAAELYMLPWELMTLPGTGQHLGALPGVVLRYEWPETASLVESPSPRSAGGRILLAFSGAGGAVPHADHQQAIAVACRDGHYAFDPNLDVLADASLSQIGARLAAAAKAGTPYACLHVLCHGAEIGSTYGLALNAGGTPGAHEPAGVDKVDARRLRQCLVAHASSLRLVVVAACDSANAGAPGNQLGSVAQALHRAGMQAVIASRYPLSVAGSTLLARTLYNALLVETTSLEEGVIRARAALMQDSATLDWASVQLYARAADGDDSRPFVFRPYRGLLAFQAAHSRFFYGREREQHEFVTDLENLVAANKPRLLVVTGASGSGKSSLVLSGLIPQLLARPERAGEPTLGPWEVATIRPGRHPSASLATALAGFDPLANSKLVIVDQFEELFTHTADLAARQKFASELWSVAADEASGVFVVLTIRVDFLGHCEQLVLDSKGLRLDQIAQEEAHRVYVARLAGAALREAIEGPARRVGLVLQQGLCERLLTSFGAEPGALPLLEHTLDQLWQRRDGRILSLNSYDELGGVAGALQKHADALVSGVEPRELRQARRLLTRLVRVGEDDMAPTRRRIDDHQARPQSAEEQAAFEAVLTAFVDARLIVRDEHEGQATLEVAHEALIRRWPRLRSWLREDQDMLVELVKLESWTKQWREHGTLLAGARLGYACEVQARFPGELDPAIVELIAKSKQRQNLSLAGFAAVLLVFVALSFVAVFQWRRAADHAARETQARLAETSAKEAAIAAKQQALVRAQMTRDALRVSGARAALQDGRVDLAIGLLREVEAHNPGPQVHGWSRSTSAALARNGGQFTVLKGHDAFVESVQWSAGETRVVTSSGDGSSRLWDAETGAMVAVLRGAGRVYASAVDPVGKHVVTAYSDGEIRAWDGESGALRATFEGHTSVPTVLEFTPDGTRMISGSYDQIARVWEVASGREVTQLKGHEGAIIHAFFSRDGTSVVTTSYDRTARVWDAVSGEQQVIMQGHTGPVRDAALSRDGKYMVTGSSDNTARLWDRSSGRQQFEFQRHTLAVRSAEFCANGTRVISSSDDGSVWMWEVASGQPVTDFGSSNQRVTAYSLHPAGHHVLVAYAEQPAQIWDTSTGAKVRALSEHKSPVRKLVWSPDGQRVAAATADHAVHIWDPISGGRLAVLEGHTASVWAMTFSRDGNKMLTASGDKTARSWLGWGTDHLPRQRLWAATRTCPSLSQRVELMGVDQATGAAEQLRCEAMVECLSGDATRYDVCRVRLFESKSVGRE